MLNKVIDIILNYVEPDDEITDKTSIKGDLGMSSFDIVCLSGELYEVFGVELSPEDFRECDTVGLLTEIIEERSKAFNQ